MTSSLEPVDALTQLHAHGHERAQRLADLDQLPAVLTAVELARFLGIGISGFHKHAKRGAYDLFKVHPCIGPRKYSTVLVKKWVSGEPVYLPSFGRKRA